MPNNVLRKELKWYPNHLNNVFYDWAHSKFEITLHVYNHYYYKNPTWYVKQYNAMTYTWLELGEFLNRDDAFDCAETL